MTSIDVVIPNYNYGHYLRGCVESVLSQDVDALRLLIIDNASNDDSAELARELAKADPRIETLLRPKNMGPHASFNDGVDWAKSDYFLILCSDDLLTKGALSHAMGIMENDPQVSLVYGKAVFSTDQDIAKASGSQPTRNAWRRMAGHALIERFCKTGRNHISGPTAIVRTAAQKRAGRYRPSLPHTDDLEMWMRIALLGDVVETERQQAIARVHGGNQSATVANIHRWNLEFKAAFESFFENEGRAMSDAKELLETARRNLGERAYWSALAHMARREAGAAKLMAFALKSRPSMAILPPFGYLARRSRSI
ncbi:glycosyltransferase family A protein [Mesorhizobium sp. SB112]|uniref:glycosyltransferase family A protein n=1 Tax=Mesorhizobium sp. SB112 TaxID=3151853 RepID=UPI003265F572